MPSLGLRAKDWIEVVRKVLERKDIVEEKSLENKLVLKSVSRSSVSGQLCTRWPTALFLFGINPGYVYS